MLKMLLAAAVILSGAATAAAAAAPAADKEKMICKRVGGTGWRLSNSNKVCKTRAQWDSVNRTNREQFQDYNKGGSLGSFGDGAMGRTSTPN